MSDIPGMSKLLAKAEDTDAKLNVAAQLKEQRLIDLDRVLNLEGLTVHSMVHVDDPESLEKTLTDFLNSDDDDMRDRIIDLME